MKKFITSFILLLFCITAMAQSYTETIYLKNGGIIKGMIIEQIPDESVKIMTKDQNVFVFRFEEISKITKEVPSRHNWNSKSTTISSGYKGFVDLGYTIGVGDGRYAGRIDFTTSHGYQINPYIYLGIGSGVNYFCEEGADEWSFPLFANPRANLLDGPITPFVDVKIGYTFGDLVKGFYLSPSLGVRFALSDRNAINFSAGYTLQNVNYDYDFYYGGSYYNYSDKINLGGITLKLGFEF